MLGVLRDIEIVHSLLLDYERSLGQLSTPDIFLANHLSHHFDTPDFRLAIPFCKTLEVYITQLNLGKLSHQPKSSQNKVSQKDVFNLSNLKWFTVVLITVSHCNHLTQQGVEKE